ncbi:MAG: DUF2442 domain-containing protein [Bacteroidales bacterium]|jgi:hypothetical protein|nr:DUF2442 domain-containing protein [Bacteroidota bacterium]NLO00212.1 DUF2442 domain-containing protein [Bacteroidales bacterium]
MFKINKIWFDGEWLYGLGDDGKTYRQSLLWYRDLLDADDKTRNDYRFVYDGIFWNRVDLQVSFESFLYDEAEPSPMQRFFLTHPEINISGFARKTGINATLLRNYINGFKKPSREREEEILAGIRSLGREFSSVTF